jgi:hypothetical protein
MQNVIKGCENHQQDDHGKADPEADLLAALGQRPAADRLDDVEQKVSAIEQRDGEEIEQADRDRQDGGQMVATCPDTCAIRIGPPSWSAASRPENTPAM